MLFTAEGIKAVAFDFGNTLIEFGPEQVRHQYAALQKVLTEMFGHCDVDRLKAIRDNQILAPLSNGYRENDLRSLCAELIQGIYNIVPQDSQINALVQMRYESFVKVVELPGATLSLLKKLQQHYRLGLLSNYPCGQTIRDSLVKIGLSEMFAAVVISGDVGYAKPHAKPFETLLARLALKATECVYVGDNWLADIQGAKRMGMHAILTTQHIPYESFDPIPGDYDPDIQVCHLSELEALLLP